MRCECRLQNSNMGLEESRMCGKRRLKDGKPANKNSLSLTTHNGTHFHHLTSHP